MMRIPGQECIKIGIQVLKMFVFFQAFFVYSKKKNWKYVAILIPCMIVTTFLFYNIFRPNDWLYWRTFSIFLLSCCLFQGTVIKRIGISFFLCVFTETLDAILVLGNFAIKGTMKWTKYEEQPKQIVLCTMIDLVIAYIIKKIIGKQRNTMVTRRQIALLCFVAMCDALALGGIQILLDGTASAKVNNIVGGSMIVVCLLLGLFSVFQILVKNESVYYQKMLEEEKKYLEMQDKYYQELYAKNKEESKLRHDWKNHIAGISALCDKGQFTEVEKYVKRLNDNVQGISGSIDCGNPIVSVLVSQIGKKAQENQIKFQVHGHIREKINMDNMDLCILVSNLLHNALEASIQAENNKWIRLDLQYSTEYFHICIRNTMKKEKILSNQRMNSDKKDVNNHGYGMQNIQDVVEKYHGMIHWEGKNYVFSLQIFIPNV